MSRSKHRASMRVSGWGLAPVILSVEDVELLEAVGEAAWTVAELAVAMCSSVGGTMARVRRLVEFGLLVGMLRDGGTLAWERTGRAWVRAR